MAKRSDFKRIERDFYPTPESAVKSLAPFLPDTPFGYCEPCAGDLRLARHLEKLTGGNSILTSAYDLEPQHADVKKKDARFLTEEDLGKNCDMIITNPPWDRTKKSGYLLHNLIERFSDLRLTYLLFDADWMHTLQSRDYVRERLVAIISIGRVKWIEDSTMTGKDNCAWYLFSKDARHITEAPEFYGRVSSW